MQPADDYVTEFTQDVPRVKVITAGEIMATAAPDVDGAAAVGVDTTLERLMPRFRKSMTPVAVTGGDGAVIGQVSAQDVLAALASAEDEPE